MKNGWIKGMTVAALFFTTVALAASMAHLFSLPNKIHLPGEEYLVVQQAYQGWSLLGITIVGALLSTFTIVLIASRNKPVFTASLIAFLSIVATQAIFWIFTFPANQQTQNWTTLPDNWQQLRNQWEYSQAITAIINWLAFGALVWILYKTPELSNHQPVTQN